MPNLFHIDPVVIPVRADPLDPHDALLKINGDDQSIVVTLDVEHDPLRRDDAGGRIAALYVRGARPPRLLNFIEPGIEGGLQRGVVLVSSSCRDRAPQGALAKEDYLGQALLLHRPDPG
jgi:hypothetical protein